MRNNDIVDKIDIARIANDLWRLLEIPSPTGNERQAALEFATMLSATGGSIEVRVDETIHSSPCVIGRLKGNQPGKVLQIAGHIDHIDVPHPEPRREDGTISGRGSCDMKCGLAGMFELTRLLQESGCDFPGEILVTVYGLHEEPNGNTKGITGLIDKGVKGDAAIIMEGPSDVAIVMTMGLAKWDLLIKQQGPVCHENIASPERHELLKTVLTVVNTFAEKNNNLKDGYSEYKFINRPESLFIGQIHYGDFFNRMPNECRLQGTRRWHPNRSFEEVCEEMTSLSQSIPHHPDISIECNLTFIGHSCEISPSEPIVQSLLSSYKEIVKEDLRVGGWSTVTDAQRLIREAGVPTIIWGACLENAHMDYELVELDKLRIACQIIFRTALDYLSNNSLD